MCIRDSILMIHRTWTTTQKHKMKDNVEIQNDKGNKIPTHQNNHTNLNENVHRINSEDEFIMMQWIMYNNYHGACIFNSSQQHSPVRPISRAPVVNHSSANCIRSPDYTYVLANYHYTCNQTWWSNHLINIHTAAFAAALPPSLRPWSPNHNPQFSLKPTSCKF